MIDHLSSPPLQGIGALMGRPYAYYFPCASYHLGSIDFTNISTLIFTSKGIMSLCYLMVTLSKMLVVQHFYNFVVVKHK